MTRRQAYRRGTIVVGAILVTASVSGYFMGLQQTNSALKRPEPERAVPRSSETSRESGSRTVPVAVSYNRQNWLKEGPNAQWRNTITNLRSAAPAPFEPIQVTEADRAAALRARASRRAYDGAPPTVPHPIVQDSSTACLACHAEGLGVKDRFASRMSHPFLSNCTQCHVPSVGIGLPVSEESWVGIFADNVFEGWMEPRRGTRAWPGAPPTIPHSTLFRTDCLSCHGPSGLPGLRTSHPERQACTQCHVPDARMDQHEFLSGPEEAGSEGIAFFREVWFDGGP